MLIKEAPGNGSLIARALGSFWLHPCLIDVDPRVIAIRDFSYSHHVITKIKVDSKELSSHQSHTTALS